MRNFTIHNTPLTDLKIVERQTIGDARGFLSHVFCAEGLLSAGWCSLIAQINHTFTEKKGTVRGMHFQNQPYAEMKLVTCLRGVVWDVAVDLREGSPTFLKWYGQELSASNRRSMLIPEGFAHGFQALTDNCELLYLHSTPYTPDAEAGLNPNDPTLELRWPLTITELSKRDSSHPMLTQNFSGLSL
tara:strand:+ start:9225 stop:9785 length:561 start_codon:yes stop_codon:yes gene_type:complete